ncbi:MAG: FkbM family methyltransferase [Leptolyngbyaceae cyanobacterium SL_7_1]|nr:FkbM family methyltransferase [Leptolyngbyaceae cyanobacterium SL_7_1]
MTDPLSSLATYWAYIQHQCPTIHSAQLAAWEEATVGLSWEEPTTAIELNNFAVMALIEAEQQQDAELRSLYLEMALSSLQQGVALGTHPLCVAHLALAQILSGDAQLGADTAFSGWMQLLQPGFDRRERFALGLIYAPQGESRAIAHQVGFRQLLDACDGYEQALWLLTMVLYQAKRFFYHPAWTRFLSLASHVLPDFFAPNLKLGLACWMAGQVEGVYYLNRAQQLLPEAAFVMQSLYLAYRSVEEFAVARVWQQRGYAYAQAHPEAVEWAWTTVPLDAPFTYAAFEGMRLAIAPTLRSAITTVLLGEGDWVEAELAFWRQQLQPDMVAIDVGANVGIYTIAAAQRVGANGRVLAVEPTSECVVCLQETCRLNHLDWVTVLAVAASDRPGTVQFSTRDASEFNRIVADSEATAGVTQSIPCVPLDTLVEQAHLDRVDWLKIDAEGHELPVLKGVRSGY